MLATDESVPILDYEPFEDIAHESEVAAGKGIKQVAVEVGKDCPEVESGRIVECYWGRRPESFSQVYGHSLSMVTAARPISIAAARSLRAGRCICPSLPFSFMELRKRINLNKEPSFISSISGGKPCSAIPGSAASPAG